MFEPGEETVDLKAKKKDPLPIGWFALFTPDDAMQHDRGLYIRRRGLLIGIGVLVLAAAWGMAQSPEFVEKIYAEGFGQSVGRGLAYVSSVVPTSVAEVFVVLAALWFFGIAARAAWHVGWRKRRAINAIACGGLHFGAFASITLALFYVLWGLNYARAPLIERQGWDEQNIAAVSRKAQQEELDALCVELVQATNDFYLLAMGSEDYGAPSAPTADIVIIDGAIDVAYTRVGEELKLHESFGVSRGRAKPVAASFVMDNLHIGGFYFPWTGEANFNRNQPWCVIPHVIAHEKAHQRCITSEDEANFFGFLACINADEAYTRYSGYLFAQRQLLNELAKFDESRVAELVAQRHPGVQRDVNDLRAYWQKLSTGVSGKIGDASSAVNNTYLDLNQVEGGIESYRMSANLIIVYARKSGGLVSRKQ
jgi:hypothetical protein